MLIDKNGKKLLLSTFLIIIVFSILFLIFHFRYIKYDDIVVLDRIPQNIEFLDGDDWRSLRKLMDKYDLIKTTEKNKYFLRKKEYYLKSSDLINILYINDNFTIVCSGPTTLDSGIRFLLYPYYSKLMIKKSNC